MARKYRNDEPKPIIKKQKEVVPIVKKRKEKQLVDVEIEKKIVNVTWQCPHCIYWNIENPDKMIIYNETELTCISCNEISIVGEINES